MNGDSNPYGNVVIAGMPDCELMVDARYLSPLLDLVDLDVVEWGVMGGHRWVGWDREWGSGEDGDSCR